MKVSIHKSVVWPSRWVVDSGEYPLYYFSTYQLALKFVQENVK